MSMGKMLRVSIGKAIYHTSINYYSWFSNIENFTIVYWVVYTWDIYFSSLYIPYFKAYFYIQDSNYKSKFDYRLYEILSDVYELVYCTLHIKPYSYEMPEL